MEDGAVKYIRTLKHKFRITKPIRLIELFSGIGSQAKALKKYLGANFEHIKYEFDKYGQSLKKL